MTSPTIAIVGKPNVGKSTIFNRLIGKRHSIIAEEAGTTRDRIIQPWKVGDYETLLVDTGGLEYGKKENIEADVQAQAKLAINEADVILFVVDAITGITRDDFSAAEILRKTKKPLILVANKYDAPNAENNLYSVYELGFGEPIKFSAIHNIGIGELEGEIIKSLKPLKIKKKRPEIADNLITISILGRPNAGKSSLVNSLSGEKKVIVSEIPGTTRDSIDINLNYEDQDYLLIDTAGIRRPGKIQNKIEKFSILRCYTAIDRSDIVILLIDGNAEVSKQDAHIAELALSKGKGFIIAVNKVDLLDAGEEQRNYIVAMLRRRFTFIPWAPVVFISAKNKKNTFQLLKVASEISQERSKRVPTAEFNTFLQKTTYKHMPLSGKKHKPKFFYGSQMEINPPKFILFFRNPQNLHFSYLRYLENEIRKKYGFNGTPIDIKVKENLNQKISKK